MTKATITRFLVVLLGAGPVMHACANLPADERQSALTSTKFDARSQLLAGLEDELGRPVTYEIERDRNEDGWRLICGWPRESDGSAFDYGNSKLAQAALDGWVDDQFCALFEINSGSELLKALDVGSTDAPVLQWHEEWALPASFLDD